MGLELHTRTPSAQNLFLICIFIPQRLPVTNGTKGGWPRLLHEEARRGGDSNYGQRLKSTGTTNDPRPHASTRSLCSCFSFANPWICCLSSSPLCHRARFRTSLAKPRMDDVRVGGRVTILTKCAQPAEPLANGDPLGCAVGG